MQMVYKKRTDPPNFGLEEKQGPNGRPADL